MRGWLRSNSLSVASSCSSSPRSSGTHLDTADSCVSTTSLREPAEGYEADDGDDDAEPDTPDQRDDDSSYDENAAEADPALASRSSRFRSVVVIDRSFVV
jgi:hypothetical protein